jgi:hypothetical protein
VEEVPPSPPTSGRRRCDRTPPRASRLRVAAVRLEQGGATERGATAVRLEPDGGSWRAQEQQERRRSGRAREQADPFWPARSAVGERRVQSGAISSFRVSFY